jgi:23S rRNA (cytidine1920-2'-O)/16S rRNA (cytidine1409-2'-O)-methyltransferase
VIERTNIRHADPTQIGAPFDVIVGDLSFISLTTVSSALNALGEDESDWILLVKPQFEAGRDRVGKGGIVRDATVRYDVVHDVVSHFRSIGLGLCGIIESPITGTTGNTEYVTWFRRQRSTVHDDVIAELTKGVTP